MQKEQEMVRNFVSDRPTLAENNNNPKRMAELLQEEVNEVIEVLDNPEMLRSELVDVVWFVLTIANLNDIDLEEAFKEKAALNHLRYQAHLFQDGDYYEARAKVKADEPEVLREFYSD